MTSDITVPEMCIYLRNGIEIWVERNKAELFGRDLVAGNKSIVQINGQYINTVEIVGIFDPVYLQELKYRKMGMWKCKFETWHEREGVCTCYEKQNARKTQEKLESMKLTPEEREKSAQSLRKLRGKYGI